MTLVGKACADWNPDQRVRTGIPVLWFLALLAITGCQREEPVTIGPGPTSPTVEPPEGTLVTLYSLDDVTCAYSFTRRAYGRTVQGGEVRNLDSAVALDRWVADGLAFGKQGGSSASALDIGDLRHPRFQTSVFHEIVLQDGELSSPSLIGSPLDGKLRELDSAPGEAAIKLGHTLLVRLRNSFDGNREQLILLRIIDYAPKRFVTFRWRSL